MRLSLIDTGHTVMRLCFSLPLVSYRMVRLTIAFANRVAEVPRAG
jgi:hypothetical protein